MINEYSQDFVRKLTAPASDNLEAFIDNIRKLDEKCNAPLLNTAGMGLAGEAGEFAEIVKKCLFHGKELDKATKEHLIKELGDVIWYWAAACRALSVEPTEVIQLNVDKLSNRYPGGEFEQFFSENRKEGDI